jgi:YHS domain-containing protein
MKTIFAVLFAAGALTIGPAASAQSKVVINVKDGLAMEGYDPVSYFTDPTPTKGSETYTARHQGGTFRFTSAAHRDRFVKEPARYAPQFGGYCGYGASAGHLAPVDPLAYTIMNGRLILQNSKSVLKMWQKEPEARLKLADQNWPGLVEKEGKPVP